MKAFANSGQMNLSLRKDVMTENDYVKICKYIADKCAEYLKINGIGTCMFIYRPDFIGHIILPKNDPEYIEHAIHAHKSLPDYHHFTTALTYYMKTKKHLASSRVRKPFISEMFSKSVDELMVQADLNEVE